jgi:hypothetical protein
MMPQFSEKTDLLFQAMANLQFECPNIAKDSKNPHFKSDYASLEDIWDVIKDLLHKHGLLVSQHPGAVSNGNMQVITMVAHVASGQFVISVGEMPMGREGPQAAGSAITYARRYFIAPILGLIAGSDDDGEAAEGRKIPAAKMGGLKERKAALIEVYQNAKVDGDKKVINVWASGVLNRVVDTALTLRSEDEVKKLEDAVNGIK